MDKLLVVIVTYNAMKWVERCFDSLETSEITPTVFVIDNGSTDGTQDFIIQRYPKIIFKQSCTNLGFGKANNIGLKYALDNDYDFVYLLNQDAWVLPNTFTLLIKSLKEHLDFGIISPIQMNAELNRLDRNFGKIYDMRRQISEKFCELPTVMAAHWMMSVECIKKVGLFSPVFYHYCEDGNYIDRLHYFGYKCGCMCAAYAVHDREFRIDSIDKQADLEYKGCILTISDPGDNPYRCMISQPVKLLRKIGKYGILTTVTNIVKLVKLYPQILKYRKLSQIEHAFI